MQPALRPGDRVLVLEWLPHLKVGDVVVFVEPDRRRTVSIKRVIRVHDDRSVEMRGDNLNVSRDSREYGLVPRELILGRAIFRYLPGARRGLL